MNNAVLAGLVDGLSALLAIAAIAVSLTILLDLRGAATSIVSHGQRLALSTFGLLFRGEHSRGITRLLAGGLLLVGLQPVFRISLDGGTIGSAAPTDFLLALFVWAYIAYVVVVRVRSGFRRMVPPITFLVTVLLVALYVGDGLALTSAANGGAR